MSSELVTIGFLLAVAAAIASVVLVRRRRRVWHRFASRHGLRYSRDGAPHVSGALDGRSVELKVEDRGGSDTAELGAQTTYLSVTLRDAPPPRTLVLETGSAIRALHGALEDDVVETGDGKMDARFTVRAESPGQAVAWLNEARREALLDLAEHDEGGIVALDGPRLTIEARTLVSDEEEIERSLDRLLACARRLDEAGGARPRSSGSHPFDQAGAARPRPLDVHR